MMRNLDDIAPQNPDQGFRFPGVFEITAMGRADAELDRRVAEILQGLGVEVLADSLRTRPSREGNYQSVSVSFTCPDRDTYDAAHAALRADAGIRWTL